MKKEGRLWTMDKILNFQLKTLRTAEQLQTTNYKLQTFIAIYSGDDGRGGFLSEEIV
jgi:hypothetical protein